MLKRLFIISIFVALLAAAGWLARPAHAQQEMTLSSVSVSLWPEFDQPSMLVIYHITLPAGASLPAELGVRVPVSVNEPNAVAARQPDNSLVTIPYTVERGQDWNRIVFQATSPELQIEYYDGLQINGATRLYEYRWPGDYAVDSFVVELQQPKDASNLITSPGLGNGAAGNDGLLYYTSQIGPLQQGQPFAISIRYDKSSDALSSSSMAVEPSAPIEPGTDTQAALRSALPWLLGFLGLLLIGGGVFWYLQSGRAKPKNAAPRRTRHKPAAGQTAEQTSSPDSESNDHIYCHQCGRRANAGDRFCRACGTPLRTS